MTGIATGSARRGRPPGSKNRIPGRGRPRGSGRPLGRPRGSGRPRRDSNSTVASVDHQNVTYYEETFVLKPLQSLDSDDWPIFTLSDAVIYRKLKNGRLEQANACNVDLEGPFIIRGRLDVDLDEPDQASSIRNYALKSAYIEIPSSSMYSVGWTDDTELATVWSSGKSGWFEIFPSPEYRDMHDSMREGVTLYYLLQDILIDARDNAGKGKRGKALLMPIDQLLLQYAIRLGDGITLEESKERCQKHAPFLLAHFNRDDTLKWKATAFYQWMSARNPRLSEKLRQAEESRKHLTEPAPLARPKDESEDDAQLLSRTNATESDRARRTRERSTRLSHESDVEMRDAPPAQAPTRVETPIFPPPIPHRTAPAVAGTSSPATPVARNVNGIPEPADPIQAFISVLEVILEDANGDMSKMTPGHVHSRMYILCSTVAYHAPKEVSEYYATPLAARLPRKWHTSQFFQYLLQQRGKAWRPTLVDESTVALQLIRRRKKTDLPRSTHSDAALTPHMGKRLPATPRTGALTLKRPRPSYFNEEEIGQSSKHMRTEDSEGEGNSSENEPVDDDTGSTRRPISTRHTQFSTTPIPAPGIPKETVTVVVRAEKIPTVSPAGPNGTWRCDEDDCGYTVRSAEEPEGKLLIEEHFEDHAKRVEKVNLALAEGTRGNMPINHLLEKIRTMGEAARKKEQGADGTFPEAVKRRLIL